MEFATVLEMLMNSQGTDSVLAFDDSLPQPWLQLDIHSLVDAVAFLQRTEGLYFDQLACLTGMDYGPERTNDRFGVVYHLYSFPYGHSLVVKVYAELQSRVHPLGAEEKLWPVVPSLAGLYGAADWHEREAYDLLGIYFEGHPDLRRMLLPEDWEGFPLQKDYQEAEKFHGIYIASELPNQQDRR